MESERGVPDIVLPTIKQEIPYMLYVGIDVAKDKHDCCFVDNMGEIVVKNLRIKNSLEGFMRLIQRIDNFASDRSEVEIGLEDTGHYSDNLVNYFSHIFTVKTINPILTAKRKKAEFLRKTKTDKIDSVEIAKMLRYGTGFRPVISIPYDSEELKSLSRYRTTLVMKRSKEKTSVKRLVNILFPEYEQLFKNVHLRTSYTALLAYPGNQYFATCRTPALTQVLRSASKGYYGEDMAVRLRELAKKSIGKISDAKSYELRQTIKRINSLTSEINEIEAKMHDILAASNPPISTIPGLGEILVAAIIGEIGDFSKFNSPDKILAIAGMSPTTYQSGYYTSSRRKMEKRGSRDLRRALYLAAIEVCKNVPEFNQYLVKKQREGKHYYVALSHAAKKLIRLMYALETQHRAYEPNLTR